MYTGFLGIGVGLMLAFVLHARERWRDAFEASAQPPSNRRTHRVEVPLAAAAAIMAVAVGALHLAWAFGAEIGVSQQIAAQRGLSSSLMNSLDAAIMIAGAAGVLMLVHGRSGRMPFWIPLTLTWVVGARIIHCVKY